MIGRRTAVGISLLCALVFCAFAAPSAFAAKGTTAFTCKEGVGLKDWKDPHCTNAIDSGKLFGHEEIKPGTATEVTVSNQKTANKTTESSTAVLHGVIAGIKGTFTCPEVHGTGSLTNEAGEPMKIGITKVKISFKKCKVSGELAEKQGCELEKEEVNTIGNGTATTPTEAMEIEFKPEAGKGFASFKLVKCKTAELNAEYTVTGTATAIPNGTTLETTEASTKNLKLAGQQASFTSVGTVTMATTEPGIATTTTAN